MTLAEIWGFAVDRGGRWVWHGRLDGVAAASFGSDRMDLVRESVGWMRAWDAGAAAGVGGAGRALLVIDGLLSPARWAKRAKLLMGRSWPSSSSLPADGSRASLDRDGAGPMRCRWWPVCYWRTACGADGGWQSSCGGAWPLDDEAAVEDGGDGALDPVLRRCTVLLLTVTNAGVIDINVDNELHRIELF
ncbi:hypothetical protein ACLOJK_002944 [Asimina triloba]